MSQTSADVELDTDLGSVHWNTQLKFTISNPIKKKSCLDDSYHNNLSSPQPDIEEYPDDTPDIDALLQALQDF